MKRLMRRDDGATLILVLVIVVVLSVLLGAVLTAADTNLRATVELRDQTSNNYAASAAANAAIRQYQNGAFVCTSTASPSSTTLGTSGTPFYVPATSLQGSLNAAAKCVPDTTNGTQQVGTGNVTIDTTNTLGYSVLTVGTNSGQNYGTVCISGGSVVSNSTIATGKLQVGLATSQTSCALNANASIVVTAAGATGCNGAANDNNANDFTPTGCTHAAAVPMTGSGGWSTLAGSPPTSGYNTSTGVNPAPLCATGNGLTYAAFSPGKYTSASLLNSPCAGGTDFEWFTPGVYYFDYGTTSWGWTSYVLGGTPQNASGNAIASLIGFNPADTSTANKTKLTTGLAGVTTWPGACSDPALQNDQGVEFVMGGASAFQPSQHTLNNAGTNELCASFSDPGIPVVIYGVSKDIAPTGTLALTGGGTISAETLCAAPPCTSTSTDSNSQSMITFASNGHNTFFVHGYIYAPSAPINFQIKNSNGVLLGWGLVLRSFAVTTNGASPVAPYIAYRPTLHAASVTYYTIRYLNIWTCLSSASPCPTTGTPNVRVKIQDTLNANGNITATKVLSWSQQR